MALVELKHNGIRIPVLDVIAAIAAERDFQDRKHGSIDTGGGHTLGEWVLLIEAELEEAKRALIKGGTGRDRVRSEIVQIAAVCFACLEQHGVDDIENGRQV